MVPAITSDYIHLYEPQGDVFTGPDTKDLKTGTFYSFWQPNDHCFIKAPDKHWHIFGITHPASKPGETRHQGEYASFHAVSSGKSFENSFGEYLWKDSPKVLSPIERPDESVNNHAPEIFQDEHKKWYISSAEYPQRGISVARLSWK